MKRKGGSKKGKSKKPKLVSTTNEVASNAVSQNTEDSNNSDMDEFDNEEVESGMDGVTNTMTPVPEITQLEKPATVDSIGRPLNNTFGKAVYTRVKVKIKTSKNLDAQHTSPDAPSQSETNKSDNQVGLGKQAPLLKEKTENSSNSLSEANGSVSENNTSQKPVGIKIKSRGLGSSSMSPCNMSELVKGGKKDNASLHQESRYNEQELKTALEVIRKVMEMEAAEPFNVPVNPVALGIPDYFDIITTPMDFGTIRTNLEKGVKYENSEDVFRDVQYVWNNCYKYNNKGNFIVELMRRVKKNFTKYWTAVGLFNDQPQENNNGSEGNPVKDLSPSSEDSTQANGSALNLLTKKFHGLKHHKEGCQCAICVMMRRRQEREEIARMMGRQTEGSDGDSMDEDIKPEGTSNANSPFGEYASSNMEISPDVGGAELERKDQEMKFGQIRGFYPQQTDSVVFTGKRVEGSQDLHLSQRSGDGTGGGAVLDEIQKEMSKQNDDGRSSAVQQQMPKEPLDKHQRAKMLENLRYLENPMLMELYGTLFAGNSRSFWNGPHSLVDRNQGSKRHRSLHSAISSLLK